MLFDLYIYHEGWIPEDFAVRDNIYYKNLYNGKLVNEVRKFKAKMGEFNVDSVEKGRDPIKLFTAQITKKMQLDLVIRYLQRLI